MTAEGRDVRYEFDAPQHYNFQTLSTGSGCSSWFEAQAAAAAEAEVAIAAKGQAGSSGREPFREATNDAAAAVPDAADKPKRTNIRTSWGADVPKKRKAEGAAGQPVAKASKLRGRGSLAAQPKTRAQHAAAGEGRTKTAKELRPVKLPFKAKSIKVRLSKVLAPRRIMPTRSTKPLTMPQELELHTSKRAHAHAKAEDINVQVEQEDGRDENDPGHAPSPFKPLVLRVKEFESKTPGRFKRNPLPLPPPKQLVMTEAKEPSLLTSTRIRPSAFKPREEQEDEEMSHMPVFKASTLNPMVLNSSGLLGVPKVEKREKTEPTPFNFITDDRAEIRAARQQQQAEQAGFSEVAQQHGKEEKDLPKRARKSVAPHLAEPVVPKSPNLRTKLRKREVKIEEPIHEFHARPLPKFLSVPHGELHVPNTAPPQLTQPEPFKLATEERGTAYRSAMAARLAAEQEAQRRSRVPRAHGLPLSTDVPIIPPKPEARPLTLPEPFGLASEARHEEYQEQKRREREAEEAAKRAEAEFKARPMWRGIPYRLQDIEMPLTLPEEVNLRTNARAGERGAFNKAVEEKHKEAELAAKQAEEEAKTKEEEERRRLRKAAEFHARPMPDLSLPQTMKPLPPKPLTRPVSPRLATKKKRRTATDK